MRSQRDCLLLSLLAGGFALLALDVLHLHQFVVRKTAAGWIPVVVCSLSCAACLWLALARRRAAGAACWVFGLAVATGPLGAWFHTRGDFTQLGVLVGLHPQPLPRDPAATTPEEDTRAASPVAPLSISGLAALALVVAWPRKATASDRAVVNAAEGGRLATPESSREGRGSRSPVPRSGLRSR